MKKVITISLIYILSAFAAPDLRAAGEGDKTVSVRNLELVRENNEIKIKFEARIGRKATRSDYTLYVIPTLIKDNEKAEFSPIVVKGKRAEIAQERVLMAASGYNTIYPSFNLNGEKIDYKATIPYQEWMSGADLTLEAVSEGCCSTIKTRLGLIASNIVGGAPVVAPQPMPATIEQPAYVQTPVQVQVPVQMPQPTPITTAPAATRPYFWYSFIAPVQEYDDAAARSVTDLFGNKIPLRQGVAVYKEQQEELDQFIDKNRVGALQVYFPQGKKELERYFRGNASNLDILVAAINDLENSPNHEIKRVVIAGFASPEGSTQINHYLGWERGKTLERFVLNNSRTIRPNMIDIYNGQVDWRGLREYVAGSNMPERREVLDIIDNVPIWDSVSKRGRLTELKKVRSGATYRFLYNNVFPDLRNATCVRIYYVEY